MIWELIAAFFGTIAFSIIFHVPTKFYPYCGMIGAVGWAVYYLLRIPMGMVMATLYATIVIVIISRFFAMRRIYSYYFFNFWHFFSGSGCWSILDSLLFGCE